MTKAGRISAQDSLSKVTGDKNIIKRTHETSRPNFHWCDLKKKMYRTQRHKFPKTHWKRNTNISPPPSQTTPGTTLNACLSSSSRKETLRYTPALGDSRGRPFNPLPICFHNRRRHITRHTTYPLPSNPSSWSPDQRHPETADDMRFKQSHWSWPNPRPCPCVFTHSLTSSILSVDWLCANTSRLYRL